MFGIEIGTLLLAISLLYTAIGTVFLYVKRKRLFEYIGESTYEYIVTKMKSPENQQAIQTYMETMIDGVVTKFKMSFLGQKGGLAKGINSQLKGLEKELIAKGINAVSPIPVGDMASEYLEKYPILKTLLPVLMKGGFKLPQMGNTPRDPQGAGELGKI